MKEIDTLYKLYAQLVTRVTFKMQTLCYMIMDNNAVPAAEHATIKEKKSVSEKHRIYKLSFNLDEPFDSLTKYIIAMKIEDVLLENCKALIEHKREHITIEDFTPSTVGNSVTVTIKSSFENPIVEKQANEKE